MARLCKLTILPISIVFSLLQVSLPMDPYFESCEPRDCGTVTITYPFYIQDLQGPYCGHPGFEVSCNTQTNRTIINLSDDTYAIRNISYIDQSLTMVNTAFLDGNINCSPVNHNLTLDEKRFKFAGNHSELFFLQNCTKGAKASIERYSAILCQEGRGTKEVIVAYARDLNLEKLEGKCSRVTSQPYKEGEGDTEDLLRSGFVLQWTDGECSPDCLPSGGRCGYNTNSSQTQCFCPYGPASVACGPKRSKSAVMGSVAVASAVGILILIALLIYLKRRQSTNRCVFSVPWATRTTDNQNVEAILKSYESFAPKSYSYADIKKMTDSFKDTLGEGGYGAVYKGKLRDGRFVAVKVLKQLKGNGQDFINEVASISRTNHMNIVTLLGFCFERKKRALVYDYLPNGSLEKFLYGANGQSLPFETLFKIAVGIARGLHYLHRGCNTRILHFDIKPHNILLDEDFCPKISDFGLARLCDQKDSIISTLEPRGTIGYIAPEVFCRNFGGISHKSDVYSYGMMVLDMACGRKNTYAEVHSTSELYFPQWIYNRLADNEEISIPRIMNDEDKKLQRKMIVVSLWCIQPYPTSRPSMSRVVEMLEGSLDSLEMPPSPDLPSSPRLGFDCSSEPR